MKADLESAGCPAGRDCDVSSKIANAEGRRWRRGEFVAASPKVWRVNYSSSLP